ncbi:hypothetical protein PBY51_015665 [Eleginops maclovinus]|uniref:Interleukin-21 n=1 Tax=Eleginops maclovinus TaxID=56733 RepID=A0AAN7XHM4_ELEMC|nr:hypothetical protein PBY51_015665 [Eleginops maclovinus]
MKFVILCLFAVFCSSLARTVPTEHVLKEVLRNLKLLKQRVKSNEHMMNTPPRNIEDSCCPLQCFQDNLSSLSNVITARKLSMSLNSTIIENGICSSGNNKMLQCTDCDTHPKKSAREFFDRLETLVQKAITRGKN